MFSYQVEIPKADEQRKLITGEIYKIIHQAIYSEPSREDFFSRERAFSQKVFSFLLGFSRNYWANVKLGQTRFSSNLSGNVINLIDNICAETPSEEFLSNVSAEGYINIEDINKNIKKIKAVLNDEQITQLKEYREALYRLTNQNSTTVKQTEPAISWYMHPHSVSLVFRQVNYIEGPSLKEMEDDAINLLNSWERNHRCA